MLTLQDIDPRIPQPGWPGRRWAIARLVVEIAGLTVLFVALMAVAYAAVLVAGSL